MMAKFAAGEIGILVCREGQRDPCGYDGCECEVVSVGPFAPGARPTGKAAPRTAAQLHVAADYEIRTPDGYHWFCLEKNLRKRPDSGIPDEVRRLFDVPRTEDAAAWRRR